MLIIDGYNLIYAIGLLPAAGRNAHFPPGKLEQSRTALIKILVKDLNQSVRKETIIVFDALEPPEFLPNSYRVEGMRIIFSRDYPDADTLIIEMIQKLQRGESAVLISSDHRIQAAARRKKISFFDSDKWYFGGLKIPESPQHCSDKSDEHKDEHLLSEPEIEYWLKYFHQQ